MARPQTLSNTDDHQLAQDQIWSQLYCTLRPYILNWVYCSGVPSWHGQENDIADDILQEAIIRTHRYAQQVESGISDPIYSITCFSRAVAHNHFRDLRRRDLRLVRFPVYSSVDAPFMIMDECTDPSEIALDALSHKALLGMLARIIASFPYKQRTALLIDLANRADFSDEYDLLQAAFLEAGVKLCDYRCVLPVNPSERGRHAALLSTAYKRLRYTFKSRRSDWV